MEVKKEVLRFHFSDFSVDDLRKITNKAKKLGATNYDVVVNRTSNSYLDINYLSFFRILSNEEIIEDEVSKLEMKINKLKGNL